MVRRYEVIMFINLVVLCSIIVVDIVRFLRCI